MRLWIAEQVAEEVGEVSQALSDLSLHDSAAGPVLLAVSRAGLLVCRVLPEGGLFHDATVWLTTPGTRAELLRLGSQEMVVTSGQGGSTLLACLLDPLGRPGQMQALTGDRLDPGQGPLAQLGDFVLNAGPDGVLRCFRAVSATSLEPVGALADDSDRYLAGVVDLAPLSFAGQRFVLSLDGRDIGLSLIALGANGAPEHRSALGASLGLGLHGTPVAVETAVLDGRAYAVVLSRADTGRGAALSVVEITPSGQMVVTDHILDSQVTRFGAATALSVVTQQDRVHVVAGGGDQGLSVFTLLPGGQLLSRNSLESGADGQLDGITALAAVAAGPGLEIYASGHKWAGLSRVAVDTGPVGVTQVLGPGGGIGAGGSANDLLSGGAGADRLFGLDGDDILRDGAGTDTLTGGAGADLYVLDADGETDIIAGFEPGLDRIDLTLVPMLYGPDQVTIRSITGGALLQYRGEQTLIRSETGETLSTAQVQAALVWQADRPPLVLKQVRSGDAGANVLFGYAGADLIQGVAGDDRLHGLEGDDELQGGPGNDTLYGDAGRDIVRGGEGRDLVFLGAGDDLFASDGPGADTVRGGPGDDTIEAGAADDELHGMDGNDLILGGPGHDTIYAGIHHDTVEAGAGHDRVWGGDGRDLVWLGEGDDLFSDNAQGGENGRDTVFAGAGRDTIEGGNGDDMFYGEDGHDLIFGRLGNDSLYGQGMDDEIHGGDGNDLIFGGPGHDTIYAGIHHDTVEAGAGHDRVWGGDGRDLVWLGEGDDLFSDNAQGGENGRDTVFAGAGRDTIEGGNGDDMFYGEDGHDLIFGRLGNDSLYGQAGDDTLSGGGGRDMLWGGPGADVFVFRNGDGHDTVLTFGQGADRLLLDPALWGGGRTPAQVVAQHAVPQNGSVLLDFGDDSLLLADFGASWTLAQMIDLL